MMTTRTCQVAGWLARILVFGCLLLGALAGCGSNTPGRMEWVQPHSDGPRAGTVYLIRGWQGIFSSGIDAMAAQLREQGVTAHVYMPEQYPELAATMVQRYKGVTRPEPICMIGHSRGSDSALIIARELEKEGIAVDLIVTLDSVDEAIVPANVRVCYNYYLPGWLGNTNLLRGIPLEQAPGSTGRLVNTNMTQPEGREIRDPLINHIDIDKGPLLQKRIIEHVLEVCPQRRDWSAAMPGSPQ